MTVTVDINVVLDVFLVRQPHFPASEAVLDLVSRHLVTGIFPSHGVSTFYYLLKRGRTHQDVLKDVDVLLADFTIGPLNGSAWRAARTLNFSDLEDAAVAQTAVESQSDWLITRNTSDFRNSPVPAITPTEFLSRFFPVPVTS
ncbi:MAG: PIN domain-containing protein [Verrucomicrobiota bacterium]